MKFSVNWLREFVDLPEKVDELAELLTLAGVEIEGIEKRGAKIDKIVVAQITASSRHPNADRLSVCPVDDGSGTARKSFAAQRITKSATKFRSRCRARNCLTEPRFEKANCAALNRKECSAARSSSVSGKTRPDF